MTDKIKIIQDISLLYELSLSVGSSLDAEENCHDFLRTLISRKSLNFGSVWLTRAGADGTTSYELFYIHPRFRESQTSIANSHFIVQALSSKPYLTISSQDPHFGEVMQERKVGKGSYAIFKLGELGFLKLFASNRPTGFDEMELAQLKQVVDKLKISLDGCFAHIQLKEETENRLVAQRAIQESEEKYRGVLENMELGLLEVDLEENIIRTNDAFCQTLGYSPDELIGQNTAKFLPDASQKIISTRLAELKKGQSGVYELQVNKKDGTPIWLLISGAPLKNPKGEIIGSIGIQFDLTERKKLEQELAEATLSADRARLAERQFLTHMSHEIRTPINALIGMTHLLYETQPSETQIEYLHGLRFSADSLLGIIDNILDLSKIDAGEIEFEQKAFDLEYLLKALLRSFQFKAQEKNLNLEESSDPKIENLVVGDPTRINQILTNLLANALKFTEKGLVSLTTKLLGKQEGQYLIEFRVHDTGIGIPEDKQETIFEYFKQADVQTNRKFGGTGLGLTIVKQLVEMQGGSIRLESEMGIGSDFIFTLGFGDSGIPISEQELTPETLYQIRKEQISGLHFLIVEDNLLNQKLISKTMQTWGCTFDVANDGIEALAKTAEQLFDIILMDIHMPNLDGCETSLAIRKDKNNPNKNVPIIALTAAAMPDEKRKAFKAGMNGFLTKPISPKMLQEYLFKTIQKNGQAKPPDEMRPPSPAEDENQIDLSYLVELSHGDKEFVTDIIETFLSETPASLQNLKTLIKTKDWETVGKLLHKMKPNFAMLGMKQLQEKAALIEEATKQNPMDYDQIYLAVSLLIAQTNKALGNLSEEKIAYNY